PPSFQSSQFDIVLRRQRTRPREGGGVKVTGVPSRFLNLSNAFEFAGWGTVSHVVLSQDDLDAGERAIKAASDARTLGQFTASALAGNAILGSVFYALPAVVAVASVYSPISLFVATLIIFLWRPIMEELAAALPISGAPYSYLLHISSKTVALVGATLLLLDFAATSVVSAATAITYVAGEVTLPFPVFAGTALILVFFLAVSMSGLKDSARLALSLLAFHIVAMLVLMLASVVTWAQRGNSQLHENWQEGKRSQGATAGAILHQIFNGVCIGMLGLTGFECIPSYVANIKPGRYSLVLRNLHYGCIVLNGLIMLLVLALVPLETVLSGANILSVLAELALGRWLRIWIVVDAVIVLSGGVLTGILSACELLQRLAHDRVIPRYFLSKLPTQAPYVTILSFGVFCGILYASSGASLQVVSKMFSLVWLTVMALFPFSDLLLKFNRGRLPRDRRASFITVLAALAVVMSVIGGNIAIDPSIAGYFSAYVIVLLSIFALTQRKGRFLLGVLSAYDLVPILHRSPIVRRWSDRTIAWIARLRRQPLCLLTKTDEINHLVRMVLYVRRNEETSCLKLVHFYGDVGIPSEMEANWKILDEAFPEITIDLVR
ncbi:hypothetical protein PUNSTDRAFT_28714, partial [Punctularia strigosozonata HHB-11173 SS5]|uniref:uncharacterized protein n=1 Tax=Punctularia strigosozonata (strain HHB-11173) TaxID=741275 RepID=UPI0004417A39